MSDIDELNGQVRLISGTVSGSLRAELNNAGQAGWGQFLEAASRASQIGPYGTAAGVVVNQIAFPDSQIDPRVKARLWSFWKEKPEGKMFPQDVRLAFTVLALARVADKDIVALRDEIAAEIRRRQLDDGSWSDALPHATSPAGGQPDSTAWAVLALRRSGGSDAAVQRGAAWLAARIEGSGRTPLLSTIGIAAAIACHAKARSIDGLCARGVDILADAAVNREELISFFDYDEVKEGAHVQTRDYLCYPAFYPFSVLVAALEVDAGFWESLRLNVFRAEAIRKLAELSGGHPYRTPTSRFSSTVDQAMYALAYEELAAAEANRRWTGVLVPLYKWGRKSILVQLVLPLLVILAVAALLASPVMVASAIVWFVGDGASALVTLATKYEPTIQVFVGLVVTLLGLPRKGWTLLSDRLRGRGQRR